MKVLVVGGAGYIGSHCVARLLAEGYEVCVVDNLSRGHRESLPDGVPLYVCDAGDKVEVGRILSGEQVDVVMHFAAYAYVGESFEKAEDYEQNNVVQTDCLLDVMEAAGVRKFVFSSTCTTFGMPDRMPITEDTAQQPINPYGETKFRVEQRLRRLAGEGRMSSVVFRYFNAAGASPGGQIGEDHDPEPHLIPRAIGAATGKYPPLEVFGTDYATPDGTCLRDYIHVEDLAAAHVMVLGNEGIWNGFNDYNLGTGTPVSVMGIIHTVEGVTGFPVPRREAPRREGDAPVLYADAAKAAKHLGFSPQHSSLENIVKTAWNWHKSNPNGYEGR